MRLVAVIDEAALRRQVGGPDVMRVQLRHLVEVMEELPRVTVQVIPFGHGAHPSMAGGFAILQFPDDDDLDAVYVETAAGELFLEESSEVSRNHVAFQHLLGIAANGRDTISLIAEVTRS